MNCNDLINHIIFLLKEGNIPSIDLNIYFTDCKTDNELIKKTIQTLKNYYNNASLEEKYLINNLLFMLESLINKQNSLKNFIKRSLDFDFYRAYTHNEGKKAINFLIYENYDENTTFEAIKEILKNPSFYQIKNLIGIIWPNKQFYVNKNWLNLFDDMTESLYKLIEKKDIEKVMPLHFVIYHTYGNNIQTIDEWKKFNEKVEIPTSKFYKQIGEKLNLSKPKKRISPKKKKIGIIFDRLVLNSPFIVMFSLIKNLALNEDFNTNYEFYIYSLNYVDKHPEEKRIINILSPFVKKVFTLNQQNIYYNHLQKAISIRNEIIEDKIDYLITMASGYDINNFIITNRSAPKQIFWSHGNCAFDIPNIDKRISHFEQECKEFKWDIFNIPMAQEFLIGPKESKEKAKILKETLLNQFGKETIFLGTIGRLIKLESEEYLKTVSEIMKQNPNTVYLACGSGNQKKVEELMKKQGIDLNRVIFTGQVDAHLFGWIIDIWLDTFPLNQGHSREEYYSKNSGVATNFERVNPFKEKNEKNRILKEFKDRETVFEEIFGFNINKLKEDVKFDELILNAYDKNHEEIKKCIEKIYAHKNRKKQWLEHINCLIQNKKYYEMYKWITYKIWSLSEKNKKIDFLKILKGI